MICRQKQERLTDMISVLVTKQKWSEAHSPQYKSNHLAVIHSEDVLLCLLFLLEYITESSADNPSLKNDMNYQCRASSNQTSNDFSAARRFCEEIKFPIQSPHIFISERSNAKKKCCWLTIYNFPLCFLSPPKQRKN